MVCGGTFFPNAVGAFSVTLWFTTKVLVPWAKSYPVKDAHTPFIKYVGRAVGKGLVHTWSLAKPNSFQLENSLVLVTMGTHWEIPWPNSKAPLMSQVIFFPGRCVAHTAALQLETSADNILGVVLGEAATAAFPSAPATGQGGLCSAAHCRGWSQRGREVWCRRRFPCRSQPKGISLAPCVPLRSLLLLHFYSLPSGMLKWN